MYTLCKSIQWLADESHVKDECGPYVVKPGNIARPLVFEVSDLMMLQGPNRYQIGRISYTCTLDSGRGRLSTSGWTLITLKATGLTSVD